VIVGNVIGSNLFNLAAVMGAASLFAPLQAPDRFLTTDLWVMLATALLLVPFVCRMMVMGRRVGVAFLALYVLYAASAFVPVL
jgi:cation:H+ antiporter